MNARLRVLLMVGLVLVLAVSLWRTVGPLHGAAANALEHYRSRRVLLTETQALLASLPILEDSARKLRHDVAELAPRILNGDTSAEAIADLSASLSLLANRQGSQLLAVRALSDTGTSSGLARVGVVVTLRTDVRGVARWLGAIATHPNALVAQRIHIIAPGGFGAQSEMESLQVELTVTGWYFPRAAKS